MRQNGTFVSDRNCLRLWRAIIDLSYISHKLMCPMGWWGRSGSRISPLSSPQATNLPDQMTTWSKDQSNILNKIDKYTFKVRQVIIISKYSGSICT